MLLNKLMQPLLKAFKSDAEADRRATAEVQSGKYTAVAMARTKGLLWAKVEGSKLVIIYARLDVVLKGRIQNLSKSIQTQKHGLAKGRHDIPRAWLGCFLAKPLPRNMRPDYHQGTRAARAKALNERYSNTEGAYFVDASGLVAGIYTVAVIHEDK
ncbi:hypothetical protein HPB50_008013 [Hyalomma asiaticum]|uniref:Uncharacterized protein n=1 Tax=Hyalomma asiaticum TaxID=266040 RepID=A0ACB7SET7_HYAAI|nr:hypothetical protein HPB50_008013 [Hyalomma asiaticum]